MRPRSIFLLGLPALVSSCSSGGASSSSEGSGPSCAPLTYISGDACVPLQIGALADATAPLEAAADGMADAVDDGDGDGPSSDALAESGAGQGLAPDPSTASAYLMNPAHTGAISDPTLVPPLALAWTASFGSSPYYALIARGLVYVAARRLGDVDGFLFAFASATGSLAWSVDLGSSPEAVLAYDDGRVFSIDRANLRAYDALTGALDWTVAAGSRINPSAPVAYRGIVYASSLESGGTLYAFDEASGALLWHAVTNVSGGNPALSDDGVFVTDSCQGVYAFDRLLGTSLWRHPGTCSGAVGGTPTLSGRTLYSLTPGESPVLDAQTGTQSSTFTADVPPAFEGASGFYVSAGALRADNPSSGRTWAFSGDGQLATPPLVVDGYVYVGSRTGALFGARAYDSSPAWSTNTGVALQGPFAAAEGVLVVPAGSQLYVYASASLVDAGVPDGGD